jgi:hypothetical protein
MFITRAQYMATPFEFQLEMHHLYYSQFDNSYIRGLIPFKLERLLLSNDPHLNDTGLMLWDRAVISIPNTTWMAISARTVAPSGMVRKCMSDGVCVLKAAARNMIAEHKLEVANASHN